MPPRQASVLLNFGTTDTWSTVLANEALRPDRTLRYDSKFGIVSPFPLQLRGESPLERERGFERDLPALLPTSHPPEYASLPLVVEACVPVAETPWMPAAALRILSNWMARLGRPDGRCMVWNIRTDRPSHGCGVLMWNEHLILNLSGYAAECLVNGPELGTINSCPTQIGADGAIELVLKPGFLNDVAVTLMNSVARDDRPRGITAFLPNPGVRASHLQIQELATSLLAQVSLLCFGVLGRSLPASAHTVWNDEI